MLINGINFDVRNLATAAKLVNELEGLIKNPVLQKLSLVSDCNAGIHQLGQQLRKSAQESLLIALTERSQASIAACLQIFFHLQSLPEVLLLAVDTTVKSAVDLSRSTLELHGLASEFPDLQSPGTGRGQAAAASSSLSSQSTAGKGGIVPFPSSSQMRVSMKECVHNWAAMVYEQSMHIHILQRVVAKKEDPSTHKRFLDVLKASGDHSNGSNNAATSLLLQGNLVELFWERLQASLADISLEKSKAQPIVASRLYPMLRKAGVDVVQSLKVD